MNINEDTGGRLQSGGSRSGRGSISQYGGESPPFRATTGTPGGLNIQDIAQESEEFAKEAGNNRIYPLEQIDEHLSDAYINMHNTEIKLESCVKFSAVLTKDKEKKVLLEHLLKKTKAVKLMIKSIANDLDKITLS